MMYKVVKFNMGHKEKDICKMSTLESAILQMLKYDRSIDKDGRWDNKTEIQKPIPRKNKQYKTINLEWHSVSDPRWTYYRIVICL